MTETQCTIVPQFIYDPFNQLRITGVIFPAELFELNHKAAADVLEKTKKMIEEFHWRNVPPALHESASIVVSTFEMKDDL